MDKQREEETLKIRKEKKVLEQRIKNMQFSQANNSQTSKLQQEIDSLRKQLGQSNVQIDRLTQENQDLKQER